MKIQKRAFVALEKAVSEAIDDAYEKGIDEGKVTEAIRITDEVFMFIKKAGSLYLIDNNTRDLFFRKLHDACDFIIAYDFRRKEKEKEV